MSNETVLGLSDLLKLRENNVITDQEVAIQVGDLFFARNVITEERRLINIENNSINETKSNQRLLKG